MLTLDTPHKRTAWALARLAVPDLNDDSMLLNGGYEMIAMLNDAAQTEWVQEWSYICAQKLLRIGFVEQSPALVDGHWNYRLTHEGRRFLGLRPTMPYEACAGWIALVKGECSPTHIHLTDSAHLQLMVYMLAAGWSLPPRRLADADTEELPAVK